MGAWGQGPFDNDDAADWSYEFDDVDEATGLQLLADALDLGDRADYLEASDGSIAVAAAQVVSWLSKREDIPDSPYGASAAAWVRSTKPAASIALRTAALGALDRVRGEQSELGELWAEADDTAWLASLAHIATQLGADTP